ncbi:DUF996 domain-containing protein [Hyperthermus butylicus]|uniref:DUF996 domain-containing protein n=1 Tax=Hyperthermus butylicus TaxID=54248 RepID=UPI00064ED4FD|nr:DUF996 domain-containing protein [Hyperthermus butylicus]
MNLNLAKLLVIAGIIVSLLSSGHPSAAIIGLVLYLVGMYGLASYYEQSEILRYALISTVGFLAGVVVAVLVMGLGSIFAGLLAGPPGFGTAIIAGLVLLYISMLAMGYYRRRLMEILARYGDEGLARLTGKLYWYGAILTIIIIGFIVLLIASILELVVVATLRSR